MLSCLDLIIMFFLLVKQKDKHCKINTFPGGITIARAVLDAIYRKAVIESICIRCHIQGVVPTSEMQKIQLS